MKKMKNKVGIALIFLLIVSICFPSNACARDPRIKDILITNDMENVFLYARLVNGFKPEMELAILAGIPTVFTMSIEVYEERTPLWDKKIASREIKRTIKYDNLKKTFGVSTNKAEPEIFPDLESAQKAMSDFNGVAAIPMSSLRKGTRYYVMIKIKMDKVRLPLSLEHVFVFVSLWDFETSWYRQKFTY
ncbi:MAG: DUF4390 domain-containing protein [Syntrophaceae bacterium]|nr:DUF4390 domain-containing protein [Syntrophaceae bacterium]